MIGKQLTKEEYTHQAERQDNKDIMRQTIYKVMGGYLAAESPTPLSNEDVSEVLKSCLSAVTPE